MGAMRLKIATNADMSDDFESDVIDLSSTNGFAAQAVFTGASLAGTFIIQASCDDVANGSQVVNWDDLPSTEITIDDEGSILWNITDAYYLWARIIYVTEAGTGSCTITVAG